MTRLRARVDNNQKEIVSALRAEGYEVLHLHAVGKGVPDILVSTGTEMTLVEIKGEKGKLTPDQVKWHGEWTGKPILIVRSIDDAIEQLLGDRQ